MDRVFLWAGIILCVLILFSLVRVVWGPTVLDRIVGGSVIGAKTPVLLLLMGLLYDNVGMFVDIALAYALLNFIAALGATKYFLRRRAARLEDGKPAEKEFL